MSAYQYNTPLSDISFAATDTETTNTPHGLRLVELASVMVLPGFRVDFPNAFQTLINSGHPVDKFSLSVHGVTDQMLESAPDEAEAIAEFAKFMDGAIFAAHNLNFDLSLTASAFQRNNIPSPLQYCLDTVKLSKLLYPCLPNHSLDTLIAAFSLTPMRSVRHRALFDADAAALLLVKILTDLSASGIKTLGDLFAFIQR
ncbi:MAG: 3'-5' exonuclease [Deferribacteraceae bacterium]|jgi:DNA polymerase III epsilon subunit family exonuclease|nr:3'-5' exonuclease [Deferribacteraceae bacterium]